ncbi:MAG: phage minor head protein, partial [Paracoccus sp. (in: a-proteobacteria)]
AATQALGLSHSRATTIMRTESLRAYRHASRATYLANQDVLDGRVWNAHLDARTCVACALMDGTVHAIDATLDGHPRCRCAMIPRTKSWEDLGVKGVADTRPPVRSGKAWLESQPAHVQRAMMGRAKFNAWAAGQIDLDDMVARTYSPQWGTMRSERSLKAILEDRNPNYFDAPATPPTVVKPPPEPDPTLVKEYAARYDLAYLQEWIDTPGNSPNVLASLKAAVNLKVARQGRIGPSLPQPDPAKVQAAVEKLAQAVATKGYPSKGYSQTKAIYKAQANGQVGTKVGVVKSLNWEQNITAQAILDEHDAALPALARKAQKDAAVAKAQAEAIRLNKIADAQVEAQAMVAQAKAIQKAADDAALFKIFTKALARQHGMTASFLAQLDDGFPGLGGHIS